jgi:hypothetical protein
MEQSHTRPSGEVVRALTSADLALLEPKAVSKPPLIKKLRESHHGLARAVAEGKSLAEISEETGYSISRISILRSDPTFAELVSYYKENLEKMRDALVTDHFKRMVGFRGDLIEEMIDRLHDSPELVSWKDLDDSLKTVADRTGMGPQTKNQNINMNIDIIEQHVAGQRRAARLSAATGGPVYESTPVADKTGRGTALPPPVGSGGSNGTPTD